MSGTEQLLYLVGVPAVVVAVIWALASIGGPRAQQRYRPGRPYHFATVWYVANHQRSLPSRSAQRPELTAGSQDGAGGASEAPAGQGRTGGVSDRW